ncbi:MAG: hypothetical protein WCI55_07650 [Armatimonadota bacterium]
MTRDPTLKGTRKELFKEIRRDILNPFTFGCFGWVLLSPFWMNPALYLVFQTFLFDPFGIIAWTLLVCICTFCLISWFTFLKYQSRHSKMVRPFLQGAKKGEKESILKILEL